jgi:hypothetical protein
MASRQPTAPVQGELAAYVWDDDRQYGSSIHVTYRGQDGHRHDVWFREWEWSAEDLTAAASATTGHQG